MNQNYLDSVHRLPSPGNGFDFVPQTGEDVRRQLDLGNRDFVRLVEETVNKTKEQLPEYLFPRWINGCKGCTTPSYQDVKVQSPFAIVVSCSDARIPIRAMFNSSSNEIFEICIAGNVLADDCIKSVDYALIHQNRHLRALVVIGHTYCGAVTSAVDAYLQAFQSKSTGPSIGIQSVLHRMLGPVQESACALERVAEEPLWQEPAQFRDYLLLTSTYMNTAYAAQGLQMIVRQAGLSHLQIFYGVYDLNTCQVCTLNSQVGSRTYQVGLTEAPHSLEQLEELAECVSARVLSGKTLFARKPAFAPDNILAEHESSPSAAQPYEIRESSDA